MPIDTREKLLDVALAQFAERGFDGVSIARIADTLGLSKQALLHHFSTKEKLYGEVLRRISADFEARVSALDPGSADGDALASLLLDFAATSRRHHQETALLMRELLDNRQRASQAGHWYLKNFLDLLTGHVRALPQWKDASAAEAATVVYQLLGAINYFAISSTTLAAMFDEEMLAGMDAAFAPQLRSLIDQALGEGPPKRVSRAPEAVR